MLDQFELEISFAIQDPDFAGFKSVICYRTGLDVPREPDEAAARKSFADIMRSPPTGVLRLQHDGLNDLLVHRTAALIAKSESRHKKPFQFHTGLGDNDISLAKASPSHLQEFIRAYPTVPIVLLHASYPFTREAGYLASVYANVYARHRRGVPLCQPRRPGGRYPPGSWSCAPGPRSSGTPTATGFPKPTSSP